MYRSTSLPMIDMILKQIEADHDNAVARLCQLLRIPSVSTDPAYRDQMQSAASWIAAQCNELRLDTQVLPSEGPPVVVARTRPDQVSNPTAPRILFYGHYDVQPPDPLEHWNHTTIRTNPAQRPHLRAWGRG